MTDMTDMTENIHLRYLLSYLSTLGPKLERERAVGAADSPVLALTTEYAPLS